MAFDDWCRNCRFWRKTGSRWPKAHKNIVFEPIDIGECRRRAPLGSGFPIVDCIDHCGEFERLPNREGPSKPPVIQTNQFSISSAADIECIRQQATEQASDEMQGGIESVAFALEARFASLPLTLRLPPPPAPDAIIEYDGMPVFGVEVTQVGFGRLNHIGSKAPNGFFVEYGANLLIDRPAKRERGTQKGSWCGDFKAIRSPEEGLCGTGLLGDEAWAAIMNALRVALDKKKAKLSGYLASVDHVWLFLVPTALIANWDDILTRQDLSGFKKEAEALCKASGFNKVLLWRERQGAVALL